MNTENLTLTTLAGVIDHTNLKASATDKELEQLCRESEEYGFASVMVNSVAVPFCRRLLKTGSVLLGCTVSFPLGQTTLSMKLAETKEAIENGADEIDYVINIGKLKSGDSSFIEQEMAEMSALCHSAGIVVKVILENCYLEKSEIAAVSGIAAKVRPDFIKTSTGFGSSGATAEDVRLMKQIVKDTVKVKAAGGIRDLRTSIAMLDAGAERLGASSSIAIIEEWTRQNHV